MAQEYIRAEDIKIGDIVLSIEGKIIEVSAISINETSKKEFDHISQLQKLITYITVDGNMIVWNIVDKKYIDTRKLPIKSLSFKSNTILFLIERIK